MLELVQTLFKFTRLTSRKSYLFIIAPNSHYKQETSRPDSSAFYLGMCRTSIQNWKICSNSHEKLTKSGII